MLVVRELELRLFDCVVFGTSVYGRSNLVLLERISSPTPLISVEIYDECAGPFSWREGDSLAAWLCVFGLGAAAGSPL